MWINTVTPVVLGECNAQSNEFPWTAFSIELSVFSVITPCLFLLTHVSVPRCTDFIFPACHLLRWTEYSDSGVRYGSKTSVDKDKQKKKKIENVTITSAKVWNQYLTFNCIHKSRANRFISISWCTRRNQTKRQSRRTCSRTTYNSMEYTDWCASKFIKIY